MTHQVRPFIRGLKLTLAIGLTGLLTLPVASAGDEGIYIETTNRSSGLTGETPREDVSKTYIADGKMKVVSSDPEGADMILDPTSGNMTFLNNAAKEYYQLNAKSVMEGMSQPGMEQMRAMMENTKVSVQDTGETKQIGSWNCKLYKVSKSGMMGIEQEVWATQDVDLDIKRFNEMMSLSGPDGLLGSSPAGETQRAEMAKIKGFPILTKTKLEMMGSKMETENQVTIIRKEPVAANIFEIPEGYKLKDMAAKASEQAPAPENAKP
jgi:hypothetical protein